MTHPTFPERMRASRQKKNFTQAEIAEAIGVTVQAVSLWETGQSGASHRRILLLSELLGVDWNWLAYGANLVNPEIPQTLSVDEAVEFQRAPMCERSEICAWVRKCPQLDYEIADALNFKSYDKLLNSGSFHYDREWFTPRFPPTGIMFAIGIRTLSMDPMFVRGDVIICDTGVKPAPGDYVIANFAADSRSILRRYRQKLSEQGEAIIELVAENEDYPVIRADGHTEGKIVGTMVEHRRYRKRRGKELVDFLSASQKGRSRDA